MFSNFKLFKQQSSMSKVKQNGAKTQEVELAKNYFAYPSRWQSTLAKFVGWFQTGAKSNLTEPLWQNAKGEVKVLRFDDTNAQNMWALEKVEEKLKCKSIITTDSCSLLPLPNSPLAGVGVIAFGGAPRRQCIFNCCVHAIVLVEEMSNNKN